MRLSPVQRHLARKVAARLDAVAAPGGEATGNAYQLQMAKLVDDRRRLHEIKSVERKIQVKGDLLPEYQDWVIGALNGGSGAQDLVLMTVLVWHIDVGNIGMALQIADYAIKHKLQLPDQYLRNVATMLLDEVPGAYFAGKYDNAEAAVMDLCVVRKLTEGHDAPDQARAKLHKAFAYAWMAIVDEHGEEIGPASILQAKEALGDFKRALELFEHIGVKKDIERLERRLKKAAAG